jgi:hypothetical protein
MVATMKRYRFPAVLSLLIAFVLGCARPDEVVTIKSPTDGVFYTIETSHAAGPVSDTTRVYAHFERNGKARKILALAGENLTVERIIWINPHEGTFCIQGGITDTFRNQVTLILNDKIDETMHHHLQEGC